jgi:hypothetical protein
MCVCHNTTMHDGGQCANTWWGRKKPHTLWRNRNTDGARCTWPNCSPACASGFSDRWRSILQAVMEARVITRLSIQQGAEISLWNCWPQPPTGLIALEATRVAMTDTCFAGYLKSCKLLAGLIYGPRFFIAGCAGVLVACNRCAMPYTRLTSRVYPLRFESGRCPPPTCLEDVITDLSLLASVSSVKMSFAKSAKSARGSVF